MAAEPQVGDRAYGYDQQDDRPRGFRAAYDGAALSPYEVDRCQQEQ
jgi:hypothetical protein